MSSPRFAVPFRLRLRGSFLLGGLCLVGYGAALVWLFSFAIPFWIKLLILPLVLVSFVTACRRHVLFNAPEAISELSWAGGADWLLYEVSGQALDARLLGSSFAHPWLVVMNFRVEGERRIRSVVMFPDSCDTTSYRRLLTKMRRLSGVLPEGA